MILGPAGLFAATSWGIKAESNPGAHGLSQIVYQFSSDSANNGSAFDGLGVTYGLNNNPSPSPEAVPWDIAAGFVIMFGRFIPIIAPIAMAGFLGMKRSTPFGLGTLRDDTFHLRVSLIRHDCDHWCAAVLAGRSARTDGRAPGADSFRRIATGFVHPKRRETGIDQVRLVGDPQNGSSKTYTHDGSSRTSTFAAPDKKPQVVRTGASSGGAQPIVSNAPPRHSMEQSSDVRGRESAPCSRCSS